MRVDASVPTPQVDEFSFPVFLHIMLQEGYVPEPGAH